MNSLHLIFALIALLAPANLLAQSKSFNQTVNFESGGRLKIEADISDFHLTAWDRNQVEVVARIEARKEMSAEYARQAVEATRIEMVGGANSLTIKANYDDVPSDGKWGGNSKTLPHINYEIRAPRHLRLALELDRSTAEIRGFDGELRLESDRTQFQASDLSGEIHLEIDRGQDAKLDNVRGKLNLQADRTNLTMQQLNVTGDSRIEIDRGNLEMFLASNAGLNVSVAKERRSLFQSDLPMITQKSDDERIEGTINGGGPRLTIQTDRAKIYLKNR